jgi:FKBP-type peptidyl-prolyl cis-trans isomerase
MQKVVLFFVAFLVIAGSFGCKDAGYVKYKGGLWYKIIRSSSDTGHFATKGQVLKFDLTFLYNDSILRTTRGQVPQYAPLDSGRVPEPYYTIFMKVKAGDSVIIRQLTDSLFKMRPMPPFMKKGNYIVTHFAVLGLYPDMTAAQADQDKAMLAMRTRDSIDAIAQKSIDEKTIQDYLTAHNIKAVKAPKGTFVEILEPGSGTAVDSTKTVGVFYTGRALADGKEFDSNTDSTAQRKDTLFDVMARGPMQGGMIEGFTDGVSMLRQGAVARLYIPSSMGYGKYGSPPRIQPNANLIFDIRVASVDTIKRAQPGMARGGGAQQKLSPAMLARLKAMQQAQAQKNPPPAQQPPAQH